MRGQYDPAAVLKAKIGGNLTQDVLDALEEAGLAIYKKKVMLNGRRPTASTPMTEDVRNAIRAYYAAFPYATQSQIATKFNVNIGRVAEALR